jgi:hypothetical protein
VPSRPAGESCEGNNALKVKTTTAKARAREREQRLERIREMVASGELVIRYDPTIIRRPAA